ncbi:hypothetical protein Gotri_027623 [Gossypium trilobum]|uniref:Uncharacterized protein n=1 Tax=Gossypium trilobum TaxID=34281 RepID=A0A7J9FQ02_9ROSI|nr:hypothetical protein [Gossypium trilobum]
MDKFNLFSDKKLNLGHYIPQLADLILDYNKRFSGRPIKLKAIALGNPLLDPDISVINAEFLRHLKESIHQNLSKECIHVLNKLEEEMGSYTDPGDLTLPVCLSPTLLGQTFYQGTHNRLHWKLAMSSAVATDPCRGDEIRQYLNTPKVQEALYANTTHLSSASFLSKREYRDQYHTPSVKTPQKQYSSSPLQWRSRFKNPINTNKDNCKYACKRTEAGACRKLCSMVGGWTQSFGKVRRGQNLTFLKFATVRGAAHEVRYTSPSQALTLFQAFLRSPLPLNRV